jgi:hypothetical protein
VGLLFGRPILLVADLFQPVNDFSVELFLNGDVGHGCGWCGPMPVFLARREPDHIPWADLLDWTTPALCAAAARGDDEGLTERMRGLRSPCRTNRLSDYHQARPQNANSHADLSRPSFLASALLRCRAP